MNSKKALKEARKRWGKNAFVEKSKCLSREDWIRCNPGSRPEVWERFFGNYRCVVGVVEYGILRIIKADGLSFEECFEKSAGVAA